MFHFGDFSSEALQHRFHHWIAFNLCAQLLRGRTRARSRGGRRCNCFEFSTDSHGATEDLARSDTELLERLVSFQHFRERPLLRREINSQFSAFELPASAVFDEFSQEFLLCLNQLLDFCDLLFRDAADLRRKRCSFRFCAARRFLWHSQSWLCGHGWNWDGHFWLSRINGQPCAKTFSRSSVVH